MRLVLVAALLVAAVSSRAQVDAAEDHFSRADQRLAAGDYPAALSALDLAEKALPARDPRRMRLWERRGAVRLQEGRLQDARDAFTSALRLGQVRGADSKTTARAYAGMGLCLRRQGRRDFALRFYKKALTGSPDEGTKMFLEDQIREIELGLD